MRTDDLYQLIQKIIPYQALRQSADRTRTLVTAGAAGAIAAAFNTPIAGIFLALEVISGELGDGFFGSVTLAAVIAAVFMRALTGAEPACQVPVTNSIHVEVCQCCAHIP